MSEVSNIYLLKLQKQAVSRNSTPANLSVLMCRRANRKKLQAVQISLMDISALQLYKYKAGCSVFFYLNEAVMFQPVHVRKKTLCF